ncbi:hypothetical protein HXX76_010985 [Chlamydomonas incerta]|uniref:Uncharacterized protein n=1 Tax=Chlamydomonas incerta TaxID=51695 RepID=A0A835SZD8_CHLIN|nr:hypothetical protein HXX76_010985 [Chlamydomonas incerta]|eukprot:KAG2429215.1 hypothetical protein HXX76_010985 [Chlamydomonas incerta]
MDWEQVFPTLVPAVMRAFEARMSGQRQSPYPVANVWLLVGDSSWVAVQPSLTRDNPISIVLTCQAGDVAALGLDEGDSLGLLALEPGGCVMAVAASTPAGQLKTVGLLCGAGGGAVPAAAAVVTAGRASPPPPPAFAAAFSVSQPRQTDGGVGILEVSLPPLPGAGTGGEAVGVREPADQQQMTLLYVHMQPTSRKLQPLEMPLTRFPVTWQRRGGSPGSGGGGGDGGGSRAQLGDLPPALLQQLPPQGRLLVLPEQGLVVLVVPAAPEAVAAAAAALSAKSQRRRRQVAPAAAGSGSAAADYADSDGSSASSAGSGGSGGGGGGGAGGGGGTRVAHLSPSGRWPASPLGLPGSPPPLAHFTVGGPVEGDGSGELLQLVAEDAAQWNPVLQAWGWTQPPKQPQQQWHPVEAYQAQLVPTPTTSIRALPVSLQWARVPMSLLDVEPGAAGAGEAGGATSGASASAAPVLCCRRDTLEALGLRPGGRLALHAAEPGFVVLVAPHSTEGAAVAAQQPPGPEPILLTWGAGGRLRVQLQPDGKADWTPLFPAEAPVARGDGGQDPVRQDVALWAPPQLLDEPPSTPSVPLGFSMYRNSKTHPYLIVAYLVSSSGRLDPDPKGSVMAVLPGGRLVVAWWWPRGGGAEDCSSSPPPAAMAAGAAGTSVSDAVPRQTSATTAAEATVVAPPLGLPLPQHASSLASRMTHLPTAAALMSDMRLPGEALAASLTFHPSLTEAQLQQQASGGAQAAAVAERQGVQRAPINTTSSGAPSAASDVQRLTQLAKELSTDWHMLVKALARSSSAGSSSGRATSSAGCPPLNLRDPSASQLPPVKLVRLSSSRLQTSGGAYSGGARGCGGDGSGGGGCGLLDCEVRWWSVVVARPLEAGTLVAPVGGHVLSAADLQSELLDGWAGWLRPELQQELRRRCRLTAASSTSSGVAAAEVPGGYLEAACEAAWALLATAFTLPYTWSPLCGAGSAAAGGDGSSSDAGISATTAAAGASLPLHLVLVSPGGRYGGGVVGLVNDPVFRPAWAAAAAAAAAAGAGAGGGGGDQLEAAEANCAVVGVPAVGGVVVPLLVTTRRLEAGAHLLLDRGPGWRTEMQQLAATLRRLSGGGASVAAVLFGADELGAAGEVEAGGEESGDGGSNGSGVGVGVGGGRGGRGDADVGAADADAPAVGEATSGAEVPVAGRSSEPPVAGSGGAGQQQVQPQGKGGKPTAGWTWLRPPWRLGWPETEG